MKKGEVTKELPPATLELIQEKGAGSGIAEVFLTILAYRMDSIRFRIFCKYVPIGVPLLQEFRSHKIAGDPVAAWRSYASHILRRLIRRGEGLTPPGCKQAPQETLRQLKLHSRSRRYAEISLGTMFAAHLGDAAELKKLRGVFCVGCKERGCVHHLVPDMRHLGQVVQLPKRRHLQLVHSA